MKIWVCDKCQAALHPHGLSTPGRNIPLPGGKMVDLCLFHRDQLIDLVKGWLEPAPEPAQAAVQAPSGKRAGQSLVYRLRNPEWLHGGTSGPRLDDHTVLADMRAAAGRIEQLERQRELGVG